MIRSVWVCVLVAILAPGAAGADEPTAKELAACHKKKQGKVCLELGKRYVNGTGVTADPIKALEHYRKACDLKVALGCGYAGTMVTTGEGTAKDEKAGYALREKACKLGEGMSCNDLGVAWSENKNGATDVDHAKAKKFYAQACKLKDALGCFNLGNIYRTGEGMAADPKQAVVFFQKSCDVGGAKGCTELGIMYYEGKAVPRDVPKAIALLERSCKLGSEVGCKNVELLKKAAAKQP